MQEVRLPRLPCLRAAAISIVALVAIAGGCQKYEARPLNLEAHHAEFLARTLESFETRAGTLTLPDEDLSDVERALRNTSGFSLTDGVSLSEAEAVALVYNADLRAARLKAGVTLASRDNAGLWEDPSLGVDLARILSSVPHPWEIGATIGFTIPISGRLDSEKTKASAEHAAELARVLDAEWRTRAAIRSAWARWSALSAKTDETREFLSRVEQVLAAVDKMEQAGELARTEARLIRIEQATRRNEIRALEADSIEELLGIKRLMGIAPTANAVLIRSADVTIGAVTGDAPVSPIPNPLSANTELQIARAEYEVAEQALLLEIKEQFPDIEIGPGYGREDGDDRLLLGLNLPIPILNANRRAIEEARAARELARAHAEGTLERLLAEAEQLRRRQAFAAERRAALESEIVPLLDRQYDDIRAAVRVGQVDTIVLLETLARQHDAKLALIDARRDEQLAAVALDALSGPPPSDQAFQEAQ